MHSKNKSLEKLRREVAELLEDFLDDYITFNEFFEDLVELFEEE